jgi:hypothetical protein
VLEPREGWTAVLCAPPLTEAIDNKPLADITTADVQALRSALVERMLAGNRTPESVNTDMIHLPRVAKIVAAARIAPKAPVPCKTQM